MKFKQLTQTTVNPLTTLLLRATHPHRMFPDVSICFLMFPDVSGWCGKGYPLSASSLTPSIWLVAFGDIPYCDDRR